MTTDSRIEMGKPEMLPEGTVTFFLTDIEGSTRLWEAVPDVMPGVIARHYQLLDDAITAHGGIRPIEQGEGDSVVGVFSDAWAAVQAAIEATRSLAAEPFAGSVSLRVRIALHSGIATKRDATNYAGPVVIRCARLRACGHGGQILVSDATAALVRDRLADGVSLQSLGWHQLKDLDVAEHVHQVMAPALPASFPPLRSLRPDKHNLPLQTTPLVGRRNDLSQLQALLADERIVTLTGSGGVGKTRLALQLAAEALDRYDGGGWWVDLAAIAEPDAVAGSVLSAIGGVQQPFASAIDQLVTVLRPEPSVLVVLDNCEHVASGCAAVANELVTLCPGVTVLSTSREPLGIAGEVTWRVPSLSLPAMGDIITVNDVDRYEALALFWDRARRARPRLTLTDSLVEASVRICERLDGIALAIELAAARCRQLSPERVARELEEHYRLVAGGGRTQLPRQRTLEASVDWSHRLLDESERRVFRRLAVFVGWFPLDAAEGVVSSFGDIDAWSVIDVVTRLVDKSLLVVDDDSDQTEPRYRMLETVRFFALEQAGAADELAALRDAHATWWTSWLEARQVWPWLAANDDAAIGTVYPNLRAALQWLAPTPDRAAPLVRGLGQWMSAKGHIDDLRTLLTPLATALHASRHPEWRRTVAWLSLPAMAMGEFDFMLGPVTDALADAERQVDTDDVASCLTGLAFLDPTVETWARLAGYREPRLDSPYNHLGRVAYHGLMPGSLSEDHRMLVEVVREARDLTTSQVQGALCSLATLQLALGDLEGVRRSCDELMTLLDHTGGIAQFLLWAIAIDSVRALSQADRSRLADNRTRRSARQARAVPAFWAGAWDIAADIAAHHLEARPLADAPLVAVATAPLAVTTWRPGYSTIAQELAERRLIEPLRVLHESLAASALADFPYHRMQTTAIAARIAEVEGDAATEETQWRSLLALAVEQSADAMAVDALEALAVATAASSPVRSARLLAAAQAVRDDIAYRFRFPREQKRIDHAHEVIRSKLATTELETARAHGEAMSLREVAAYAQRTLGRRRRPSIGWDSLTPTEREVARLVAEGLTNPDLGRKLGMTVNTVKTHVGHIYTKLDITSRAQLAGHVARVER